MRPIKVLIFCVFAAVFVFACAGNKKPKQLSVQESIRPEASFFRANCVVCHGAEAEGKDLSGRLIPSLRSGDVLQKSDEHLYNQIMNGGNGMPTFRFQMTEPQMRNMVRFIRDLQKENY